MKKSTLLTVASVGAVALTSAMTFAAWDTLSVTSESDPITFEKIDVTEKTKLALTATKNTDLLADYLPSAEGKVTIDVGGIDDSLDDKTMLLVPDVKKDGTSVKENFDIKIFDGNDTKTTPITLSEDGYKDGSVSKTNTYTVVVKAKDGTAASLGGQDITVSIAATLQKTTV